MSGPKLYGLLAEFSGPDSLVRAVRELGDNGYRRVESYSPFAIEEMPAALRFRPTAIPAIFLVCALLSTACGYLMQYYASTVSYPENIGGRPLHSWPAFIPITFEMAILGGVLGGVFGMIFLNRLPRYSHPISNIEKFRAASSTAFFLCVEASDPHFQRVATADHLRRAGATEIFEVPL